MVTGNLGPQPQPRLLPQPLQLIEAAVGVLTASVQFNELATVETHTVVEARGLESQAATQAFGRYLTGALAGAVSHDAKICGDFLPSGVDGLTELDGAVRRLVGNDNQFSTDAEISFRDTKRNAWIAEGVMHALLVVRSRIDNRFLVGPVEALADLHTIPTQQGLDAVAIYSEPGGPVVAIGESKASREGGSAQLTEAAKIFQDVDDLKYGPELRAKLATLRRVLPQGLASSVSNALWLDSRCYFPMIVHETPFDLQARRRALGRLSPDVPRKRVIAICLNDFQEFFNDVSDAMRLAVSEVVV